MKELRREIRDLVLTEEEKMELQSNEKEDRWYDYQKDVLNSNSEQIAFAAARQTGKTELVKEWAKQNGACIVTPTHSGATNIVLSSRTFGYQTVFSASQMQRRDWKNVFNHQAIAFDGAAYIDFPSTIMEMINKHSGSVLMAGTDRGNDKNPFIEFCIDNKTEVFGASIRDCPNIGKDRIEQYEEYMSHRIVVQEVHGDFIINPEEM